MYNRFTDRYRLITL